MLDKKQQENIFSKMKKVFPKWLEQIDRSFLNNDFKEHYKTILFERWNRLE
ncbi:MAG: hypothetical protein MUF12_02985 [Sediminibacterium sp.]|nr:hypothetical protein [Sediminibacterium sp.]